MTLSPSQLAKKQHTFVRKTPELGDYRPFRSVAELAAAGLHANLQKLKTCIIPLRCLRQLSRCYVI